MEPYMPWTASSIVNERMKFVTRVLDGDKITDLCIEFGISRKTGHKIIKRFKEEGPNGLLNKSKAPIRVANKLADEVQSMIVKLKMEKPTWGAPKIRELYMRKYPNFPVPAKSTIHAILDKNGLVKSRRKKRYKAKGTSLSVPALPNDLWCTDFKGQFRLGNKKYCYPLTITDQLSRRIIACEGLESVKTESSFEVYERAFSEFGLPKAMRSDNGVPFSHPQSLYGLSPLSAWWLRLGIKIERIKPGHPEQNGQHERMHRTLKESLRPIKNNFLQQQEQFDEFVREFNDERPHEALNMKTPSEVYKKSNFKLPIKLEELEYPNEDMTFKVTKSGDIWIKSKRLSITRALRGYTVGVTEQDDGVYSLKFMDYDMGFFNLEERRLVSLENPFSLT